MRENKIFLHINFHVFSRASFPFRAWGRGAWWIYELGTECDRNNISHLLIPRWVAVESSQLDLPKTLRSAAGALSLLTTSPGESKFPHTSSSPFSLLPHLDKTTPAPRARKLTQINELTQLITINNSISCRNMSQAFLSSARKNSFTHTQPRFAASSTRQPPTTSKVFIFISRGEKEFEIPISARCDTRKKVDSELR